MQRSKQKRTMADIRTLATALEAYWMDQIAARNATMAIGSMMKNRRLTMRQCADCLRFRP
ncbi:MAG TPA: hypothetical protein VGK31_08215 [Thermoanaerobaculia bacterium]